MAYIISGNQATVNHSAGQQKRVVGRDLAEKIRAIVGPTARTAWPDKTGTVVFSP